MDYKQDNYVVASLPLANNEQDQQSSEKYREPKATATMVSIPGTAADAAALATETAGELISWNIERYHHLLRRYTASTTPPRVTVIDFVHFVSSTYESFFSRIERWISGGEMNLLLLRVYEST